MELLYAPTYHRLSRWSGFALLVFAPLQTFAIISATWEAREPLYLLALAVPLAVLAIARLELQLVTLFGDDETLSIVSRSGEERLPWATLSATPQPTRLHLPNHPTYSLALPDGRRITFLARAHHLQRFLELQRAAAARAAKHAH